MSLFETLNGKYKSLQDKLAEAKYAVTEKQKSVEEPKNIVSFNLPVKNSRVMDREKTANSSPATSFKQEDTTLPLTQKEGRAVGVKPVKKFDLNKSYDDEQTEPISNPIDEQNKSPRITKDSLVFQESTSGNGIPYIKTPEGDKSIADIYKTYQPKPLVKPINRIIINDPQEGSYVIDTPEKLSIANQIKAIADEVAPEYTNYLLKLAQKEGGFNTKAFRGEKDNPGGGDDRGIFQINSKSFPTITNEMAQDVKFSVLWAISLIESTTPKKGDGRYSGQEKWMADPAVRRSSIIIE